MALKGTTLGHQRLLRRKVKEAKKLAAKAKRASHAGHCSQAISLLRRAAKSEGEAEAHLESVGTTNFDNADFRRLDEAIRAVVDAEHTLWSCRRR